MKSLLPTPNNQEICKHTHFIVGELYMFHPTSPMCPRTSSLWGVIERIESGRIFLTSSSHDNLHSFDYGHWLSDDYLYCRLSTRPEVREYISSLTYFECARDRR